jgi:hypothetical protein
MTAMAPWGRAPQLPRSVRISLRIYDIRMLDGFGSKKSRDAEHSTQMVGLPQAQ